MEIIRLPHRYIPSSFHGGLRTKNFEARNLHRVVLTYRCLSCEQRLFCIGPSEDILFSNGVTIASRNIKIYAGHIMQGRQVSNHIRKFYEFLLLLRSPVDLALI